MPKSVLISGCSKGGIGSALAETFHAAGLHVYATARSRAKMAHLEELPNATLFELDVVSSSSIEAAVEMVRKETGSLDILVNNAGAAIVKPALDVSVEEGKKLFDTNLWGVVAMTQAFAPMLVAAKGTVVNMCSIAGYLPSPWTSLYNCSKAALASYSESLRLELAPFQVKVITLVAGSVESNLLPTGDISLPSDSLYHKAMHGLQVRNSGADIPFKTPSAQFANTVVNNVLGGTSGAVWTGAMSTMVWFVSKFIPGWVVDRVMSGSSSGLRDLP